MNKYIVLYSGNPDLCDELTQKPTNRLAIMSENWKSLYAYSKTEKFVYDPVVIPKISYLKGILAHIIWNPIEKCEFRWRSIGQYDYNEIIIGIKHALKKDDDIIQQWFAGDDVVRLLESAKSIDDLFIAVHAICGYHETDQTVLKYVEKTLVDLI